MKRTCEMMAVLVLTVGLSGCIADKTNKEKVKDLEYTVVKECDIPKELHQKIEEKKDTHFKLTYEMDEYLYIAQGYGLRETEGYHIQIHELCLTENAIFFDTELLGPEKGEEVNSVSSFPYIVVLTKLRTEPVVFGKR